MTVPPGPLAVWATVMQRSLLAEAVAYRALVATQAEAPDLLLVWAEQRAITATMEANTLRLWLGLAVVLTPDEAEAAVGEGEGT